ncbi:alpha/beta fold hydrolase [Kribbella sp. CWNU-51]
MGAKTVNKLAVPGATLHYEVTGSGPMLLLIAGGGTDAAVYDGIVGQLAAEYTVVA